MTAEKGVLAPVRLVPRAKPVEAMRWTGDNWDAICAWVYGEVVTIPEDWASEGENWPVVPVTDLELSIIDGHDDEASIDRGDWLVRHEDAWWWADDETLNEKYQPAPYPDPRSQRVSGGIVAGAIPVVLTADEGESS